MWEEHLKRAEFSFGKYKGEENLSPLEKCVILMKEHNCSYKQISLHLGCLNKKYIREILLKYRPDLLNIKTPPVKKDYIEKRVIGIISKYKQISFDLEEFDNCDFYIENGELKFKTETDDIYIFNEFDERTKLSILYNIARLLNIDIKTTEFT